MIPASGLELVPLQTDAFAGPLAAELFLVGRLLFGAILAFNGINHFLDTEAMAGYAGAKGLPAPKLAVLFSGGMLLFGGVGIAFGIVPTLAAGAMALFLLVATPLFHDFWAVPEDQKQSEMINFLKNVGLLGGALVFLALSGVTWPYSAGIAVL
ncbi:DoxX family protein [Natrarchaeobius sp. A-rgal3]|uniref:DoxX family protein n=1 Tax=Natrarchaeobius versutus TaxID=1679078 RepID=UPI003510436C